MIHINFSVGRLKRHMAEICVKAVVAVADLDRKDVNLDLIKVRGVQRQYKCSTIYDYNSVYYTSRASLQPYLAFTGGGQGRRHHGRHSFSGGNRHRQGLQPPSDAQRAQGC